MKVGRQYVGKYVEFVWRDPTAATAKTAVGSLEGLEKGRSALAIWKERGVIIDLTEGVVVLEHSYGIDPPIGVKEYDEHTCTWVPEELIESITIYVPEVSP